MNKITSQIKFIGISLSVISIALILLTLNLNYSSKNDGHVVNIAGKERMLTQKMAKELFLNLHRDAKDFNEFEAAKKEFLANLSDLTEGNDKNRINPPPTLAIKTRLQNIKQKSDIFLEYAAKIKGGNTSTEIVEMMYLSNNMLLSSIDETVRIYSAEVESQRIRLEALQYFGGALILFAVLMSVYLVKQIEAKFDKFLHDTREIGSIKCDESDFVGSAEDDGELEQAKSKLKNFMDKVEKVVAKAQKALDESQNAISELEASTKVVEKRLLSGDLDEKTKKEMENYVDESEDLTISSLEEIAGTKEMLSKFKEKLNEINQKIG